MASKVVGNVFQVLCPTRNYGVGARVTRKTWSKFPEPTYWEITRIHPSADLKHGKAFGRFTFRGKTDPVEKRINVPLKKDWIFAELIDQQKENNSRMRARVDALLRLVEARGAPKLPLISGIAPTKTNVIAYSGGVDSTLAAKIVHQVFPETTVACLGISPSLSKQQLQQARDVAEHIRVPLWTCATTESQNEHYVANQGQSCYYCKTNLYTTINEVADFAMGKLADTKFKPVLYNGTNADDKLDPTRLGLVAASQFEVVSPLSGLTKNEVREIAKYLGLPNWNYAASPCLRSRLAFGVEAVEGHLKRVEEAEDFVRRAANLEPHHNMRVRFLTGNRAAVELESSVLESAKLQVEAIDSELRHLGFDSVEFRAFRSGSLSGYNPVVPSHHSS